MTKFVMNIEKIINNNKVNQDYPLVKEMEDTLTDIYKKNLDEDILENDKNLLLQVKENNKYNITLYPNNIDLTNFKLEENLIKLQDNLIFNGSYIRTSLLNLTNLNTYKKEIFITSLININWKDILTDKYDELDDMYVKKVNEYIIYIHKTCATSPAQVLFSYIANNNTLDNTNYLMRFGMYQNDFYATPMFILDYNLNLNYINKNNSKDNKFLDPIFKTPLDLFNINIDTKNITNDIFSIIEKKEYNETVKEYILKTTDINKLKDKLTCIEYALDLYINEECLIIKQQIRLIILELLNDKITFKRHPGFYAEIINLEKIDNELFLIITQQNYLDLRKQLKYFNSIETLNTSLLEYYMKIDNSQDFYNYIKFISGKIDQEIINNILTYNPVNIITKGIHKNYLSEYNIYKIILLGNDLNYSKFINFNVDIAINFIDKIISMCKIKSFYFIYKLSPDIINILDSNKNTILHRINQDKINQDNNKEILIDFIKLIITLDANILTKKNNNGETCLLYHAKKNNLFIVETLINIIKSHEILNTNIFKEVDNDNNNILHILSSNNYNLQLIKLVIFDNLDIINMQNNLLQTPILISTLYSAEDIFFLYKSLDADMDLCDEYGNLVYHYICLNSLCLGIIIKNKHNIFGYKPSNYCKISTNYYYFSN